MLRPERDPENCATTYSFSGLSVFKGLRGGKFPSRPMRLATRRARTPVFELARSDTRRPDSSKTRGFGGSSCLPTQFRSARNSLACILINRNINCNRSRAKLTSRTIVAPWLRVFLPKGTGSSAIVKRQKSAPMVHRLSRWSGRLPAGLRARINPARPRPPARRRTRTIALPPRTARPPRPPAPKPSRRE
jgi:hypothetical protein